MSQDNKDEDEEEIRLRDQVAIAAMQALMDRLTARDNKTSWIVDNGTSKDYDKDIHIIARAAYKMADAMRKARLKSFD